MQVEKETGLKHDCFEILEVLFLRSFGLLFIFMIINPWKSPLSAGAKFEKLNQGIIMTTPFFSAEGFQ